jgi:hypothetical protein
MLVHVLWKKPVMLEDADYGGRWWQVLVMVKMLVMWKML